MDLFCSNFTTCGLFIVIAFFLLRYCYHTFKIYSIFPILHLLPSIVALHVTGNIPKDIPFSGFLFQNLIAKCQQFSNERLVLTYILRPILIIFSEEPMKLFLNEKKAGDKPPEYRFIEQMFGPGLITSNGERWKKHRKIINPSFQLGALKDKVPLFNKHASTLVKDMESLVDNESDDPLDLIKYHYFGAVSESVFGLKQNEENKAAKLNYFHIIDKFGSMGLYMYTHPWLQWKVFNRISSSARKYLQVQNELFTFTKNVITEMEKLTSSKNDSISEYFGENMRKSLTYILLQNHLKDPSFTLEDLHAEVTTFIAAGYDTVSCSTIWCLFLLGLYPEVQEKAFNEVNSINEEYISYEESCKLMYLESVIMETLRLYPVVPLFGRQTSQDVQFGKYKVPKDSYVGFFIYLWHRNPDIFPDPENFDPERFLNKGVDPWTYIPFAEGNRTCIGKKYALIIMKIYLAYILRNFRIVSLDKREDITLCWNIVLTPAKPLRIRILSRSDRVLSQK